EFRHMLLHHGFRPRALGYQTRHDLIGGAAGWKRRLVRTTGLQRGSICSTDRRRDVISAPGASVGRVSVYCH
ncbi:MAG: hypothetical protein ABGY75_17150, partial [Gemmataceae bacterium]